MIECKYCKKWFEPSAYQLRQYKKGLDVYCCRGCATASRYNNSGVVTQEIIENIKHLFKNTELSYDEIQKLSNLSKPIFAETVKKYNLGRTKEQANKLRYEHTKATVQKKYGVDNVMSIDKFRDKIRETHSKRTTKQKQDTVGQIKQTKLERYGNETYHNIEQTKKTMLERYGVDIGFKTEKAIANRKQTSLERYDVDNPFKSEEVRDLGKQVMKDKYGYDNALLVPEVREKIKATNIKRYGHSNAFQNKDIQDKQNQTMLERYGVEYGCLTDNCTNAQGLKVSKINKEFSEFIGADQLEFTIGTFSYDIKKGDTLIEIDPTYTHNSYINPFSDKPTTLDYHINKTKLAKENGYQCIHIFDWNDWEKIKYLLQDKETLYARDLQLEEVDIDECAEFLNKYHLQDSCKGQSIRLGLFKDDGLIEIMTFGKPRYNKNYEWELLRLCTKAEYKVVGGAEKLFKHFIEKYEPESIISYCDFSKFTGEVYTRLGFKQNGKPKPSKHWSKGSEHITDNLLRQRGYDQLFNANYGKGTSNEELMLENGWLPIYDCGQLTFIWKNNIL